MKRLAIVILSLSVVGLAFGTWANACEKKKMGAKSMHGEMRGHHGMKPQAGFDHAEMQAQRMEEVAEALDLSEEQRTEWTRLHREFRDSMSGKREARKALHQDLERLFEEEPADATAIGNTMLELRRHRNSMQEAHEALKGRLEGILNPAQLEKFRSMPKHHAGAMKDGCPHSKKKMGKHGKQAREHGEHEKGKHDCGMRDMSGL